MTLEVLSRGYPLSRRRREDPLWVKSKEGLCLVSTLNSWFGLMKTLRFLLENL